MKKAWIEDGRIRDICHGDPAALYHPDVAAFYDTDVPDDAENSDGWVDGQLVKPQPPAPAPPAPPAPRLISADDVRKALTLIERVRWDNATTPEIVTVKLEFASPRCVEEATALLDLLVEVAAIAPASRATALS